MQSKIFALTALLLLASLFFFCKKDDAPQTPPGESPFYEFFKEPSVIVDTVEQATDTWEYGFVFTPLKSGKITGVGIRLPAVGTFTVTLWNLDASPVVMATKTVTSTAMHADAMASIPPVALQEGSKYGITVLSDAFYRLSKPSNAPFDFPKTIGNIQIDFFKEDINNSGSAAFVTMVNDTRITPCVNVIFIAD